MGIGEAYKLHIPATWAFKFRGSPYGSLVDPSGIRPSVVVANRHNRRRLFVMGATREERLLRQEMQRDKIKALVKGKKGKR